MLHGQREAPLQGLTSILGPGGRLERSLPGFEARPGQLEMAERVEQALREEHILLCEAGTGTGKTLAYLVPAILSGKKVVVSTATRTLQDQIAYHDLPRIEKHLGLSVPAVVLKGLGNYLCLRRYAEFRKSPAATQPAPARALRLIDDWRERTVTGDVAELDEFGVAPVIEHIVSSSETRLGPSCPHFEDCYVTRAKRASEAARIVIVNHHLFFADLALRGPHPARVLPDYDAVIFDEAHHLEAAATQFFGFEVSSGRIDALLGEIERTLEFGEPSAASTSRARSYLEGVRRTATELFATLDEQTARTEGQVSLAPELWVGELRKAYFEADTALESLASVCESLARNRRAPSTNSIGPERRNGIAESLELCQGRALTLREQLGRIVDGARGNVTWFSRGKRSRAVGSSPIELASVFSRRLFEIVPSVVLTSATLTSTAASRSSAANVPPESRRQAGESFSEDAELGSANAAVKVAKSGRSAGERPPTDFSFMRRRLGLVDAQFTVRELALPSPFDFPSKVLLYIPRDLPLPGESGSLAAQRGRIRELLQACDGGALVLSTSFQAMRELASLVHELEPGRKLLVQGSASKRAILDEFRTAMNAVLIATMSFWEGVDVPGQALRLVVIDRIPFPVPSDPLLQARSEAISLAGGQPFMDLHLPLAQITLKQGFGRLIRNQLDWGVVALLDGRVRLRSYGRRLLRALPPARQTEDLAEVVDFFRQRRESEATD